MVKIMMTDMVRSQERNSKQFKNISIESQDFQRLNLKKNLNYRLVIKVAISEIEKD